MPAHMPIPLGSLESRSNIVRGPGRASAVVNADIEKTNRVSRRKGFVRRSDQQLSGPVRLLFSYNAFGGHFYRYVDGAGLIYVAGRSIQWPAYPDLASRRTSLGDLVDPYFEIVPDGETGDWPIRGTAFNITFRAKQADMTGFPAYSPEGPITFIFSSSSPLDTITPNAAPTVWTDGSVVASFTIEGGSSPTIFRIEMISTATVNGVEHPIRGVGYGIVLDPLDDQNAEFDLSAWDFDLPFPFYVPVGFPGAGAYGGGTGAGETAGAVGRSAEDASGVRSGIGLLVSASDPVDPDVDPEDVDYTLSNFRATVTGDDLDQVQLDWDYPDWVNDLWKPQIRVDIFRGTDAAPTVYGDGTLVYSDNGVSTVDTGANTAYDVYYSAWFNIEGVGLFGPFTASSVGLLDAFSVTSAGLATRGTPLDLTIQALTVDGKNYTNYTPDGDVFIHIAASDANDIVSPSSTPNTGWASGAKTVAVTISGGLGDDTATLTVSDGSASGTEEVLVFPVLFADDFNRGDGALGADWTGLSNMQIEGERSVIAATGTALADTVQKVAEPLQAQYTVVRDASFLVDPGSFGYWQLWIRDDVTGVRFSVYAFQNTLTTWDLILRDARLGLVVDQILGISGQVPEKLLTLSLAGTALSASLAGHTVSGTVAAYAVSSFYARLRFLINYAAIAQFCGCDDFRLAGN